MSRLSAICVSFLLVAGLGCSNSFLSNSPNAVSVTGNWQFTSASPSAARLSSISGELTGGGATISGIFHADGTSACLPATTAIDLHGSTDSHRLMTLTGSVAGGKLTLNGTLAADGKSMSNATYTVVGGGCAFAIAATAPTATAQAYTPIAGDYTGTFMDANGPVISITASLTQTPMSDTSGNFQLSGTANFADPGCFSSPVSIADSQVTGGSFTLTYADAALGNSVTAMGTFSTDGKTLTVTNWTTTGPCGPDSGTGIIARP